MVDFRNLKKILVCLRWGIGDTVMEIPALTILRTNAPDADISIIGAAPATELLEADPSADARFTYQEFGITHWGDEGNTERNREFKEWLQTMGFEAIIDPSHAALAIGRTIWETGGMIFDAPHEIPDPVLQRGGNCIQAVNSAVSRGWRIPVPEDLIPQIRSNEEAASWSQNFVMRFSDPKPLLAIATVASSPLKAWPAENFGKLCHLLIHRGFNVLAFCGPAGPAPSFFVPLADGDSRHILFPGTLHLLFTASLISQCRLLICNDTGLMHVAAASGTPVVGIFGPTDPSVYLPRRPESCAVVSDQANCPHRFTRSRSLGPPECILQNRCLLGFEPCISRIEIDAVVSAVDFCHCRHYGPGTETTLQGPDPLPV